MTTAIISKPDPLTSTTGALRVVASIGRSMALAVVLLLGGALSLTAPPATAAEAEAVVAQTVNINRADAATLASVLTGIGPSRAEEIIRYREAYGPFESIDELTEVKGIGKSTLEKNRARITLE